MAKIKDYQEKLNQEIVDEEKARYLEVEKELEELQHSGTREEAIAKEEELELLK
jgi:hypothetical protein